MTTFRTLPLCSNPYPIEVTDAPRASLLVGLHGPIAVGTPVGVYWLQALGSGAQPVTSGHVAIAYGAATPGDAADLMVAGVKDAAFALSDAVAEGLNVSRDVVIGHAIPAGVDTWVVFVATPTDPSNPPRVEGGQLNDRTASGTCMLAAAGTQLVVGQTVRFAPIRSYDCKLVEATVTVP